MSHSHSFVGKFRMVSQENLDEYLKTIGVSAATRAMANNVKANVECEIVGDEWHMKVHTGVRDMSINFKLGVEQEIDAMDGRHIKAIWNLDGDKLIAKEHWDGKEAIIVHHVDDDDWTSTLTCNGVRCVRHFKRE